MLKSRARSGMSHIFRGCRPTGRAVDNNVLEKRTASVFGSEDWYSTFL